MSSLDPIARQIADAFNRSPEEGQDTIGGFYAETVNMLHAPAGPMDGPMKAVDLNRGATMEMPIFRKALDGFRAEATTRVDGDTIILDFAYLGTPADGKPVRIPFLCELGFENGKLVNILAHVSDESMAIVQPLLTAAGLTAETFQAELAKTAN